MTIEPWKAAARVLRIVGSPAEYELRLAELRYLKDQILIDLGYGDVVETGKGLESLQQATSKAFDAAYDVEYFKKVLPKRGQKLVWDQVKEIKRMIVDEVPLRTIAKEYRVGYHNIYKIKHGKSWIRVPWPDNY